MDISKEEAESSLKQIQAVTSQTRKTIAASYDSAVLMMWGLICILSFLGTHFFLHWAWTIWISLCGTGCIAPLLSVGDNFVRPTQSKSLRLRKLGGGYFGSGVCCLSICLSGFPF
jgi:hypothetical protein